MKKILAILLVLLFTFFAIQVSAQDEEIFKIVGGYCSELSTAGVIDSYDNSFATGWGGNGGGIWAVWELEKAETLPGISIAFAKGNERQAKFDIQVSADGENFTAVLTDILSSGDTLEFEYFAFPDSVKAKYIKYIGNGNTSSLWTNVTEVKFLKKSPELQDEKADNSGVGIVSKADYVCENSMIFQSGNTNALFMGENVQIVSPVIDNGRMLIPLRVIVEKRGGKILWDEIECSAACVVGNVVMKLKADSNKITVNGKEYQLDVRARIINGTFMVPVKIFSDYLKMSLMWDGNYSLVFVSEIPIPKLNKWELADIDERITEVNK